MSVDQLKLYLRLGQHKCFYHFTDVRNLPSIAYYGLLSLNELDKNGIPVPAPGGNDWSHQSDRRIGMDKYVHLCFLDEHPMEYRQRQGGHIGTTKFLQIRPEILDLAGVLVCAGVANKAGAAALPLAEGVARLDLEVIYARTNWSDKLIRERRRTAKKYELLVPDRVDLKYLINV